MITELKDHMTLLYSRVLSLVENLFVKKNAIQDLLSSLSAVISTTECTEFLTSHVIDNPAYIYKFQLKTTMDLWRVAFPSAT